MKNVLLPCLQKPQAGRTVPCNSLSCCQQNRHKQFITSPLLLTAMLLVALTACTTHQLETRSQVNVAPVEIKPIHITIDVNIKVDRALNDFFGDLDKEAGDSVQPQGK